MCCHKLELNRGTLAAAIVGCIVLLVLGILLMVEAEFLVRFIEHSSLVILPGTQMYPNWVDLPVPIITSIYLFNVTNADYVVRRGARPKLEQVGPYVYHEYHHKTKLRWNNNGTVTYQQIRTYQFVSELSNGTLEDKVVTLNAVAAGVNAIALKEPSAVKWTIGALLVALKEKLFVEKTVREILFDGYVDPVLDKTPDWLQPNMPKKFGYYYQRNGSDWFDGVFNMYTGEKDLSEMCHITSWNYSQQLASYPRECGKVHGAGDFFSPDQNKTFVELFSNDLCRTLKLDFDSTTTSHGISVNAYKISPKLFANATQNKANWCYDPNNRNLPSGVFDAGPCRLEAPVLMSQPHFYQADTYYLRQLQPGSLSPDKDKHETTFLVEPLSGLPVDVVARFQVNFYLRKIGNMELFKHLRNELFVPTVWFESRVTLPGSMLAEVWLLSNLRIIFTVVGCVLLGLSITLCSVVGLHFWNKSFVPVGVLLNDDDGNQSLVTDAQTEDENPQGNHSPQVNINQEAQEDTTNHGEET